MRDKMCGTARRLRCGPQFNPNLISRQETSAMYGTVTCFSFFNNLFFLQGSDAWDSVKMYLSILSNVLIVAPSCDAHNSSSFMSRAGLHGSNGVC